MKQVTIEVTQEDIDKGIRNDSNKCPVALACLRIIGKTWINVYKKVDDTSPVWNFVRKFDRRQEVEPFSFVLQVVED